MAEARWNELRNAQKVVCAFNGEELLWGLDMSKMGIVKIELEVLLDDGEGNITTVKHLWNEDSGISLDKFLNEFDPKEYCLLTPEESRTGVVCFADGRRVETEYVMGYRPYWAEIPTHVNGLRLNTSSGMFLNSYLMFE